MEILDKLLSNDTVGVDEDAELLEHGIDVGVLLCLSPLMHHHETAATSFNVLAQILKLLSGEGHSRSTKYEQIGLKHFFVLQFFLVNLNLQKVTFTLLIHYSVS